MGRLLFDRAESFLHRTIEDYFLNNNQCKSKFYRIYAHLVLAPELSIILCKNRDLCSNIENITISYLQKVLHN